MALKNRLFLITFLFCNFVQAKSYSELIAKQANENIRFISSDGKFTYFQKRSGNLLFSRNYKIIDILKGQMGSQYSIFTTSSRKKMLISQNENFHTFLSLRNKEKIYLSNFGETNLREIGKGISPKLHLDDNWISYFDPYSKILNFEHSTNSAIKFQIKLNNKLNPYFIPEVVMLDENNILYTDLGEQGNFGIISFNRANNKTDVLFKSESLTSKIELRICNNYLFIGEFGILNSDSGTIISKLPISFQNFKERQNIYQSQLNDLGNITCSNSNNLISFIKNYGNKQISHTDIVELNLETQKIEKITDLGTITTLISMDGLILSSDKGKIIIIKGENDFKNADRLKNTEKENNL